MTFVQRSVQDPVLSSAPPFINLGSLYQVNLRTLEVDLPWMKEDDIGSSVVTDTGWLDGRMRC